MARTDHILGQYVERKRIQISPTVKEKDERTRLHIKTINNKHGLPQQAISPWNVIIIIITIT